MLTSTNSTVAYVLTIKSIKERLSDAKNLIDSLKPLEIFNKIYIAPAIFWQTLQSIVEFLTRFPEHTFSQKFLLNCKIGQVANALSHISMWHTLIEGEHDSAMIFEDDIYVSDINLLTQTMTYLSKNNDFDWVRIHLHKKYRDQVLKKAEDNFFTDDLMPWGFATYYITKLGAKKMLKFCHNMDMPIDHLPPLLKKLGILSTKTVSKVF